MSSISQKSPLNKGKTLAAGIRGKGKGTTPFNIRKPDYKGGIDIARTGRRMREYHLTDADLEMLGAMHWISIAAFSFGAFFLLQGFDIIRDHVLSEHPTSLLGTLWYVMTGMFVAALLCYAVGGIALVYRGTRMRRIKRESVVVE